MTTLPPRLPFSPAATLAALLCCFAACRSTAHFDIDSNPQGGRVEVDGVQVGVTPCWINYTFDRRNQFWNFRVTVYPPPAIASAMPWNQIVYPARTPEGGLLFADFGGAPPARATAPRPRSAPGTSTAETPAHSARPQPAAEPIIGFGTGFLVDTQYVVTAWHVADGTDRIDIFDFASGKAHEAYVVAKDQDRDICLLRLTKPSTGKPLRFARPDSLRAGERVFLLGFPMQGDTLPVSPSITDGVAASLEGLEGSSHEFRLTAASNPGNSGGPVTDASGNVVGVLLDTLSHVYTLARNRGLPQGSNFAIKSDAVRSLLEGHGAQFSTVDDTTSPMSAEDVYAKVSPSVFLVRTIRLSR